MAAFCDLHTHCVFSDGSDTPEEILQQAEVLGLSAVALCDHSTISGLPRFLAAAKNSPVQAISGAEFSVDFHGKELHLLGLFIPETAFGEISALMQTVNDAKEESNRAMIASLHRAGYSLDYDSLKAVSPSGLINRAHIAAELTRLGYTESIANAFQTLLRKRGGHYTEPARLSFFSTIDFLRSIHAVPVLAHPLLQLSIPELSEMLPAAKRRGLIGMECLYSTYTQQQTNISLFLAAQNSLIPSGGSDYHGSRKPDIQLGSGKGNLKVPAQWVQALERTIQ